MGVNSVEEEFSLLYKKASVKLLAKITSIYCLTFFFLFFFFSQEFGNCLDEWLWLRIFHEVAVKMFDRLAAI